MITNLIVECEVKLNDVSDKEVVGKVLFSHKYDIGCYSLVEGGIIPIRIKKESLFFRIKKISFEKDHINEPTVLLEHIDHNKLPIDKEKDVKELIKWWGKRGWKKIKSTSIKVD